jgi:DNA repair protein RecN (Recombination protein N)
MLQSLHIRDFAIVKTLELEFEPGFTVLTGETGAGKSILIDALALALGERAEAGVIRHGATRAEVSVSFALKQKSDAARWLAEHDLEDDGACLLRRVVEIDKPSRAYINGRPVPIQTLRDLGELLVDIHGQHEHQSLLKREAQRRILDDHADLGDALAEIDAHYREWRTLTERLETLSRQSSDQAARVELLRHQVRELEALNLAADEIPALEDEHARLANGAELLEGAQTVAQMVYDNDEQACAALIARAQSRLEALAKYDSKMSEIAQLLSDAAIQIDEAASRLHQYLDSLDLDPARLSWVENRIAQLQDLARKHRVKPEELPQVFDRLKTELADIEDYDLNLDKLKEGISREREAYGKVAKEISRKRKDTAKKLSRSVTDGMQELGMPGGRFEIALEPLPEGEISAHGLERVEFLVSANPGQPAKPLNKVASGGELSRVSLAIQVVTSTHGHIPTLIFDEVDVGVGGRVAEIVGRELRTLGQKCQALCITHLAQVAAQGQHHVTVAKRSDGKTTDIEIKSLNGPQRVAEIARMIGGVEINQKTLAHAEDMLARIST